MQSWGFKENKKIPNLQKKETMKIKKRKETGERPEGDAVVGVDAFFELVGRVP